MSQVAKQANKVVNTELKYAKGWNTTDLDEIKRRKLRAKTEKLLIKNLGKSFDYFGDFMVISPKSTAKYLVEIRSLSKLINSCSCLDYKINGLGTCKHIERVFLELIKRSSKKKLKQRALVGSPKIEVYLDPTKNNQLKVMVPRNSFKFLQQKIKTICTDNSDLVTLYRKISYFLQQKGNKNFRISKHLKDFVARANILQEQKQLNQQILHDDLKPCLKLPLYPYQEQGMLHLVSKQRALLADEMGLGKTIQAIAACILLAELGKVKKVLVITTSSVKNEWLAQIKTFTNQASIMIEGNRGNRLTKYQSQVMFYVANYEQAVIDGPWLQVLLKPDLIILDEAQRIKNWRTKTANQIKKLTSRYAFVLTGTPLENRIDDLYSIVQFLDPYLFGPLFRFNRQFYQLDDNGKAIGYKNLDLLHAKLQQIMLRRLKADLASDLPQRMIKNYLVALDKEQRIRYEEYELRVSRLLNNAKHRNLTKEEQQLLQRYLACMRMICDSPYILDPHCKIAPKIKELANILEDLLLDPSNKIIIFSEWVRMLELVQEFATTKQINFAWHTGSLTPSQRKIEIERFKTSPDCRLFLSTDAGSLGLNLQVANVVINLDLPWNPAKLEQRIARAWRQQQTRAILVVNFIAANTIEERMLSLLAQKHNVAKGALDGDPELHTMELPSGRKDLVAKLAKLMPDQSFQSTAVDPLEWFDKKALACAKKNNKKVIAILEQNTQQAIDLLQQQAGSNLVEIIDQTTFDLLQQLAKKGILQLNPELEFFKP